MARPLLLRERDPDQAAGVAELDAGDKSSGSFGNPHRLLVLEPVTDASTEELRDERQLCLVPTEPGLEITGTRSLVLEQTVKRQPGSGHRHGEIASLGSPCAAGVGSATVSMFAADVSRVCYEARATSSRGWRRDTTCETPSGPIVTP